MSFQPIFLWCLPMLVVAGPASPALGRRVAELLEADLASVEWKLFPDGESYIRLPRDLKGERVVIVQSTPPPQDKRLMELFFLVDLVKDLGASEVIAVVPYLAYMRQDKRFMSGEAVSIKVVAKLLESVGVDAVVLVDSHSKIVCEHFNVDVIEVSAMPLIGEYFAKMKLPNPFVLAPDAKAFSMIKVVAEKLGAPCDYLKKVRDRVTGEVKTFFKEVDVEGREVIIVDDIISTGGTIANAARIALDLGASCVYASCTHALLVGGALDKLRKAGVSEVVGTDTIESDFSKVSVAPTIVQALKRNL